MKFFIGNPEGKIKGQWQFRIKIGGLEFIWSIINWNKLEISKEMGERLKQQQEFELNKQGWYKKDAES